MLLHRVITALALVAVLLPALMSAQVWPFALFSLVLIGATAWEWGRLNGLRFSAALALGEIGRAHV